MYKAARVKAALAVGMVALSFAGLGEAARAKPPVPDLTAGGQPDDKHDWNLGPTGARGWIWGWNLESTDARQILITRIDPGSPADGVLEVGDVILGIGAKSFDSDARKAFGRAIGEAEAPENKGLLKLMVWRPLDATRGKRGKTLSATLKLRVMGRYADTAPFGCEKSRRIVEAGCRYIAKHRKGGIDGEIDALALLASGNEAYLPLVRDLAHEVAARHRQLKLHGGEGMVSWHWGYANLFLTEYYLATGDRAVLPAIRELSVNIANGQSGVGSWGHGMAWPQINGGRIHGSLGGYGALNQAGLICHLSMVLAQKCGVRDKAVQYAVDKANRFFGFYIDKGAIPYGDHRPGWTVHDENGKNSIAAVLFDLQNDARGTKFFSRMTVASYGERERGHTGNYFSFLWGPLGANRAGDAAAAAYLKELRWFYDLNRRADGSFPYQGGAGMSGSEHKYGGWDCTGAFVLAYALPGKRLYITGKGVHPANALTGDELADVVAAGRGFDSWAKGITPYEAKNPDELLTDLRSWSSAVRYRAAVALAGKPGNYVPPLVAMLDGKDLLARYGACSALGEMKARAAGAVPALTKLLNHKDVWLRIQACYALSGIGGPAKSAVPAMLKLALRDDPNDPRQFTQRYLCFCLFYPGGALRMKGLLANSIEGQDRALLFAAARKLLGNDDGRARGTIGSLYDKLSYDEIKPLLPAVLRAIKEPAPSGVMFASGIRLSGLKVLAKHHIAEGMPLCLDVMDIERWGKRNRITGCLQILGQYGGAAKPMIPRIRQLIKDLRAHREARGLAPQIEAAQKLIADIEADKSPPTLRHLDVPEN